MQRARIAIFVPSWDFLATLTRSCSLVRTRMRFIKRKATADFMQMLFNLPFIFSFDLKNLTLRQDGSTAWIFTDGNMIHTGDKGNAAGNVSTKPYRFSVTLVKHDGRWSWRLFHGSVPGAE